MNSAEILRDPAWLAHRYDEGADSFRFIRLDRDRHRTLTFLTDEHLGDGVEQVAVARAAIDRASLDTAPAHFVFHSAYCCSTLVARMFDVEGLAMGLKEPVLLNDMVGWRRRGASPETLASVLDLSLALLSRAFGEGEIVVVKPSNIVNSLAPAILALRPEARAIQLFAPIEDYLASIAGKGLWGRRWVRQALVGQVHDGVLCRPFSPEELLELTDLQAAGLGWLSNHGIFQRNRARFGADRVALCDSDTLLADPAATAARFFRHFGVSLSEEQAADIAGGEAFSTNSKDRARYSSDDRAARLVQIHERFGEEIAMVAGWVAELARESGIDIAPRATELFSAG